MTQMERLEQAKAWLEQLAQGQDPITGEPLPDDSVARVSGKDKMFLGCAISVAQMIAEDEPEPDPNRTNNFKNITNLVTYYIWSMKRLGRGDNLRTVARPLDPKDPLGRKELRECFAFVEQALNNSLLAGYFTAKGPFALPQGTVLPISQEPVELAELLETVNALRDAETVRPLTPNTLEPYLASQGMLEETPRRESRKAYFPAPGGKAQGITSARPSGGTGATLVFSPQAQQYVTDHMDDLAAYLADPSRWEPSREGQPLRQIDILKRAKDYLEQLSCGKDPITGRDLSGVSAAGEESVCRLLASCAQDLFYMSLHDEPQLYPDGSVRICFEFLLKDYENDSNIKSYDAIARSILGMERLARGCHPDTGASLEPQDPLTGEKLGKCFAFVGQCLRNTYIARTYTAKGPFNLSEEARSKIYVSPEPVTAATLAGRINAQLEDSTAVRGIAANGIWGFLEFKQLIKREDTRYRAVKLTARSEALGIRLHRFEPTGRAPFTAPAFDANAQQYVIDHLDDMIRIRQESYEQRKAYLAEKLEKLETSSGQPSARGVPSRRLPARKHAPQGGKEAGPLRQLDIVRRVYDYLDRLACNMDPITQAALPADSAAGEDSVRALMRACCGDLDKMIANDDPDGKSSGRSYKRFAFQREDLTEELRGMELLSQGLHPYTEAPLDPGDPLCQERLGRCFAFAAQCLRNTLSAGYFTARVPFSLSPEARARISVFPEPVDLHTLWKRISAQREDETAMRALSSKAVVRNLISQGFLKELPSQEIVPTPEGEALGIQSEQPIKVEDTFCAGMRFGPAAQQYIVDHLDDITFAWQTRTAPAVAARKPVPRKADDGTEALGKAFRRAGGPEERQADALARAKGYMEQLRDYTDPLTGEYLTGDQTVRNAGVNRLFSFCVQALERMIAYDGGARPSPGRVSNPDALRQSAQSMELLAQGCHPQTGAGLDPKDPLTQEGLRGCFAFVAQCLERALNAGAYSAKVPFFLPPEVRPNIDVSPDPIGMMALLDAINAQLEDKTAMRILNQRTLSKYLLSQGVLDEVTDEEGKKRRIPGPRGEALGVTQCEREEPPEKGGTYLQVVYGPAAQQFVIDHLDELAALQAKK